MTTRQKSTWAVTGIVAAITIWYAVTVIRLVRTQAVSEIDLTGPLLQVALAATLLAVAAHIALGITSPPDNPGAREYERGIHRDGTQVGWFVLAAATIGGVILVLLEAEGFWVASVLVAGLLTAELTANTTRLVLYRRRRVPAPTPA